MIKLTKKELKTPDQIWQTSRSLLSWMTDQFTIILILVGLTFASIISGIYIYQTRQKTEGRAQYHYSLAKTYLDQLLLENTDEKQVKDRAAAEADLKKELDVLTSEFKSSYANQLADGIRAELAARNKNWAESSAFLERYTKALVSSDKDFGLYPLAQTYEQAKDYAKALSTYENILSRKDSSYSPLALLGKARALKQLNRANEAKQAYEIFLEKYPNSPEVGGVRGLLALLQEEATKK